MTSFRSPFLAVLVAPLLMLACSTPDTPDSRVEQSPASQASPVTPAEAPGEGPCALLTIAEVRRVFPNATAGKLDRSQEQYGNLNCLWDHPEGRFSLLVGSETSQSVENEARGWTLMFLDPLNRAAERNVRFEPVTGVGDHAMAIVERADKEKGFLTDAAVIVVQRGEHQATLMSTDLAKRDRAEALKALEELGKAVANRLS